MRRQLLEVNPRGRGDIVEGEHQETGQLLPVQATLFVGIVLDQLPVNEEGGVSIGAEVSRGKPRVSMLLAVLKTEKARHGGGGEPWVWTPTPRRGGVHWGGSIKGEATSFNVVGCLKNRKGAPRVGGGRTLGLDTNSHPNCRKTIFGGWGWEGGQGGGGDPRPRVGRS